jgi:hypothetical protein
LWHGEAAPQKSNGVEKGGAKRRLSLLLCPDTLGDSYTMQ